MLRNHTTTNTDKHYPNKLLHLKRSFLSIWPLIGLLLLHPSFNYRITTVWQRPPLTHTRFREHAFHGVQINVQRSAKRSQILIHALISAPYWRNGPLQVNCLALCVFYCVHNVMYLLPCPRTFQPAADHYDMFHIQQPMGWYWIDEMYVCNDSWPLLE
jgi:hypothetical protein